MFIEAVFHRSTLGPDSTQTLVNDDDLSPAKTSNVPESIFIWYWKDRHQYVSEIKRISTKSIRRASRNENIAFNFFIWIEISHIETAAF